MAHIRNKKAIVNDYFDEYEESESNFDAEASHSDLTKVNLFDMDDSELIIIGGDIFQYILEDSCMFLIVKKINFTLSRVTCDVLIVNNAGDVKECEKHDFHIKFWKNRSNPIYLVSINTLYSMDGDNKIKFFLCDRERVMDAKFYIGDLWKELQTAICHQCVSSAIKIQRSFRAYKMSTSG